MNYLLKPGPNTNVEPRPGAAIAIIIIYFLLLIPMVIAYVRTIILTQANPGYIPEGPTSHSLRQTFVEEPIVEFEWPCATTTGEDDHAEKRSTKKRNVPGWYISTLDLDGIFKGDIAPPPGMEDFYKRDVFQCDPNGLPIWCGTCRNWKPDRAHHCSDVGRCVWKLDHFCPWVAGVVSETNYKFFVQFNIFAALFTAFITIVMGVFIAENVRTGTGMVNVTWIIVIALSGLFLLFTGGLAGKSIQDLCMNLTTVDAIDYAKRTVFMAVKLKRGQMPPALPASSSSDGSGKDKRNIAVPWQGTIAYPFVTKGQPQSDRTRETFAILCTPPGLNPWSLGPAGNWKSVMGEKWYDWFLPVKMSPCCDHSSLESMYQLGPAFRELLVDAGIEEPPEEQRRHRWRRSDRSRRDGHGHRPRHHRDRGEEGAGSFV